MLRLLNLVTNVTTCHLVARNKTVRKIMLNDFHSSGCAKLVVIMVMTQIKKTVIFFSNINVIKFQ